MATKLTQRRGFYEKEYGENSLEEGNFRTKSSGDDDTLSLEEKKTKHTEWWRSKSWAKLIIATVVTLVFLLTYKSLWMKSELETLLDADIEVADANAKDWPLIHIVHSRFMQEQGPLETLGMARLKLFLTFCLPSMIQQSSQTFFWIIKTDPQFTKTAAFDSLLESVRSHDNIYVVASNANYVFGSAGRDGSWGDGKEGLDLLQSKIYSGDIKRLKTAISLRKKRLVLETRLDADDGLHKYFIEYIQGVALRRFQPPEEKHINHNTSIPNWLYWCSRRHIEWHSDTDGSLSESQEANLGSVEFGYMNVIQHDKLCVTPGITIGYNNNVDNVPKYDHDEIYKSVRHSASCYDNADTKLMTIDESEKMDEVATRGPCLELVEDFLFCSIRSRTWTSAGMYGINLAGRDAFQTSEFTEKLWAWSKINFALTERNVKETQNFLIQKKRLIAQENLMGQCSSGHSCKDSAKEKLREIIDTEDKG